MTECNCGLLKRPLAECPTGRCRPRSAPARAPRPRVLDEHGAALMEDGTRARVYVPDSWAGVVGDGNAWRSAPASKD